MKFSSGLFAGEVPVDGGSVAIEAAVKGNDLVSQHGQIWNSSLPQTLTA